MGAIFLVASEDFILQRERFSTHLVLKSPGLEFSLQRCVMSLHNKPFPEFWSKGPEFPEMVSLKA